MVWPLVAAMAVDTFSKEQERQAKQAQQRREAAANIQRSSASSLGAPTYNVDAERTLSGQRADDRSAQRANVMKVAQFAGGQMNKPPAGGTSAGGATPATLSPIEQDYENNPPMSEEEKMYRRTGGGGYGSY